MTSIIKFEPLSGVFDENPLSYLLQIDDFVFLLDCGWDENFNIYVNKIDAVLLSYPDMYHLGALPYLVGKCGLNAPIYATIPVYKMGQMFMYDIYQSHNNNENFKIFNLDDVDNAFDRIIQLKFSQTVGLKSKGHGLHITPISAGHMLGGTIWKIVKDGEEEILYAVDFNHKKERGNWDKIEAIRAKLKLIHFEELSKHLNGCQILENLSAAAKCSLMITDTLNAQYEQTRRRARDEALVTKILHTLRNQNGNVLLPIDTAGRVLEIAHLLDQLWRNPDSGFGAYPLCLLNNVSYNVVAFAQSQIEWMSEKISKSLVMNSDSLPHDTNEGVVPTQSPFHFKHLILCHSLEDVEKIPSPKVVLASSPGLESGFARDLFLEWCGNAKNSIILTIRTTPGTLARTLIDDKNNSIKTLTLEVKKRVKLEGQELFQYRKREALLQQQQHSHHHNRGYSREDTLWKRHKKRNLSTAAAAVAINESLDKTELEDEMIQKSPEIAADSDFSSGSSDDASSSSTLSDGDSISSSLPDKDNTMFENSGPLTHARDGKHMDDLFKLQPRKSSLYDVYLSHQIYIDELQITNFKRYRKKLIRFPFEERRIKWDEYGESVDPNQFNYLEKSVETHTTIDTAIQNQLSSTNNTADSTNNDKLKEIPTKCVSNPRTLSIRASIVFIDFEGKSDGESYKKIISQIKPKQLILIHGPEQATLSMANYFKNHLQIGIPPDKIFCPMLNEIVNATLETRIYKVKIKDALASTFRFSKYKGTELGKIRTKVKYEKEEENDNDDIQGLELRLPTLDIAENETLALLSDHHRSEQEKSRELSRVDKTYFVGDIKLTDFKQVLSKFGINQLEFLGPVLVCNDIVSIRKNESGKITFEGPVCSDYFKIRELFYQQFAII